MKKNIFLHLVFLFVVGFNVVIQGECSSLHDAAFKGDIDTIKTLLKTGVNVDLLDDGITPLHYAALSGDVDAIKVLLKAGADVNHAGDGFTPLHYAALKGHVDAIKALLKAKAKVDAVSGINKRTPLFLAVLKGHVEAVEILLDAGANERAEDGQGVSPLRLALDYSLLYIGSEYKDIVDLIVEKRGWQCLQG